MSSEIPGWDIVNFKDFVYFQEGPGLRTWQFKNHGMKVINVTNLVNGFLDLSLTDRYIDLEEFRKQYAHFEIEENDIVIASSGNSYCKVGIVRRKDLPLMMNTSVIRLKPLNETELDRRFLHFFLQSKLFKGQIDLLITGAAQPNFGPFHLNRILLPKPRSIKEQRKIASILSNVDNLIQKTDQVIEQTQRLKKGLMKRLLTKGIGHTKFKKTELGEIPEGWIIELLKNVVSKIGSGITPRGGSKIYTKEGIPFIRSQNVHFDGLRLDDVVYLPEEIDEQMKNTRIKPHDVLLNITGASIGRCSLVPLNMTKGNVNQHVCIIRTTEKLDPFFLNIYLSSSFIQNLIRTTNHGLSREGLTFSQIAMFPLVIPPIKEQQKIASIISNVNNLIQNLKIKKKSEEILKKGLMQQLLTGKLRVKV
jgi:type I restriction enzyme S subunit